MKRAIKRALFGTGEQEKTIRFGLASGLKMKLSLDHKLQRYLGLEEREVQQQFKKFAHASGTFVDIGASDGYYGLVYKKINPNGHVYLCDANGEYGPVQKKHFEQNAFLSNNVHIISKFVSDHNDVNHVALDTLLKDVKGSIFIKIDVDGGELHVLKGVEKVLNENDCKLIVETHSKELEDDCIEYLKGMSYSIRIIKNAWWRAIVPEERPIPHNRWFIAEKTKSKN